MSDQSYYKKRKFKAFKRTEKASREQHEADWKSTSGPSQPIYKDSWKLAVYYKCQGIVSQSEWLDFFSRMQDNLPSAFRINLNGGCVRSIEARLDELRNLSQVVDGKEIRSITPLNWYPDQVAYQLGTDGRNLKKQPELQAFRDWLVMMGNNGQLTRQESVSMIPALLLSVKPSDYVIDLCAAPGSKTGQILDCLISFANPSLNSSVNPLHLNPTTQSLLVSNDVSPTRAAMLVHHSRRVIYPSFMVTNHAAQFFPMPAGGGMFDRVLCDVPCTGDGTLRKNPMIWKGWTTFNGFSLHPLQLCIAKRGFKLLKFGGRLVYSTCSLNPIENEAVVAELLRWGRGELELMRIEDIELNSIRGGGVVRMVRGSDGLIWRDGICNWLVLDDAHAHDCPATPHHGPIDLNDATNGYNFTNYSDYNSYLSTIVSNSNKKKKIKPTMFAPSPIESAWMNLDRCMRVLPQDNDSGGFFVAVFSKRNIGLVIDFEMRCGGDEEEEEKEGDGVVNDADDHDQVIKRPRDDNDNDDDTANSSSSSSLFKTYQDSFYSISTSIIHEVLDFYDIELPVNLHQIFGRGQGIHVISYLPDPVYDVVMRNSGLDEVDLDRLKQARTDDDDNEQLMISLSFKRGLHLIHAGIKLFEKNSVGSSSPCLYRLLMEGLPFVISHMRRRCCTGCGMKYPVCSCDETAAGSATWTKSRVVELNVKSDFELFLDCDTIKFADFVSKDAISHIRDLSVGSFALDYTSSSSSSSLQILAWRGRSNDSVGTLCSKVDRTNLRQMLAEIN